MTGKGISRRNFLRTAGLGVAALAAPTALRAVTEAAPRPNIIFVMADDMGYGDLGCYGQKKIKTPHIDRLAREGLRFTDCYAGSTVCAPSRSVLMTGQHTGRTRVRGNKAKTGGVGPEKRVPLQPADLTVAEVLKGAGYVTGITGKWGLGEPDTTGVPNRQGFDEWFGYLNQAKAHSYYPPYLWRNETKELLPGNQNGKRETYSHFLCADWALDFIRKHQRESFFLYLAYTVPHAKYEIPSVAPYENESWAKDAKVHAAMITRLDADVGRLMALLKECGIDNNTLVFFCSDNGAARRWEGVFDSSGPLRGRKRDMYEGGIRVPMIARWPSRVAAGKESAAPWYFADFLPTAAQLAGAKPPKDIDGVSIVPTLWGLRQDLADRFLYWEFHEQKFIQQAVRWRHWKAVRLAPGQPLELYDLRQDLAEQNNLAEKQLDIVARIEEYLKTARTPSPNWG